MTQTLRIATWNINSLRLRMPLLDKLVDLMERRSQEAAPAAAPQESRRAHWAREVRAWFGLTS